MDTNLLHASPSVLIHVTRRPSARSRRNSLCMHGLEHPTGILHMCSSNYYNGTDPLTYNIEHNCFTPTSTASCDTAGMGALPTMGPYESVCNLI